MERADIGSTEYFKEVIAAMNARGLLLGTYDAKGAPNAMTIGWGALGSIWSMPVWIVLVRPSRYTYECIEHSGCFTVNVPTAELEKACAICGTRSGRDGDKLADAGLTVERGSAVAAPVLVECPIVYECAVVHSNDVLPGRLIKDLADGPYAAGDYHRVYFGRIERAAAASDAAELLGRP